MATGFLGAGAFPTEITEHEFETVRYDELDDMVNTTGTAMLGLTVGCARCHDHKYDPIPTRDYYRLASVFGHTIRTEIDYDPAPDASRAAMEQWEAEHRELVAARGEYEQRRLAEPFERWLQNLDGLPSEDPWRVLDFSEYQSKEGASLEKLDDGSILASGELPDLDEYTLTADVQARDIRTLRVEALTHPSFPQQRPRTLARPVRHDEFESDGPTALQPGCRTRQAEVRFNADHRSCGPGRRAAAGWIRRERCRQRLETGRGIGRAGSGGRRSRSPNPSDSKAARG